MIGLMSSFAAAIATRAETQPDGEVVRLAGAPGWTAGELWERSLAIAGALARLTGKGDVVATCLPAGPEAIAVTTAISALGGVELPLSPDVDERLARTLARSAGCVTTVTTGDLLREAPFLGQLGCIPPCRRLVGRCHSMSWSHRGDRLGCAGSTPATPRSS